MTRGRKILAWTLATLVLIVAALALLAATFDWNRARPYVNDKASQALGRPFAIQGDLRVRWAREPGEGGWRGWVPWPHVQANDIVLGNPPWAATEGANKTDAAGEANGADNFASLERVDFRVAPLPLLAQRVHIPDIRLTGPAAHLQRLADGRATWQFDLPESDGEPSAWQVDIGTIGFDRATVSLQDAILKADVEATVDPLGQPIAFSEIAGGTGAAEKAGGNAKATNDSAGKPAPDAGGKQDTQGAGDSGSPSEAGSLPAQDGAANPPGDYAFGWQAKGRYQGQAVQGEGKVGGLLALQGGGQPFPLQADLRAGPTRIALAGTLTDPLNLAALDLELKLSGRSMADLYPLTGITLPDTPPYSTDGRLRARLGSDGSTFDYQGFTGRVGASDLAGDLRYVSGPGRPRLSGKLVSKQLRLADLGPLIGVENGKTATGKTGNGDAANGGGATAAGNATGRRAASSDRSDAPPPGKVLPAQEFRTDRWDAMDADVAFTGQRIVHSQRLPLRDISAHLLLEAGVLTLDPLRFGVAGGNLNATLRLDGSRTPMNGRVRMAARGFKLKELFPGFEPMQTSLGELNGDAALAGTGNSVAALLGSGDGEVKLLVNDGAISRGLTEIAGLNVANYVVTKLFGDDEVKIHCAAADLGMQKGVMTTRLAIFDTENALVQVDGTADFRKEALDLDIRPHSKGIRLISLRSPLYVRGSFADPQAGVQAGPLVARGAGMVLLGALVTPAAGLLALIAPSTKEQENQCATLLRQMQQPPKARGR